MCSKIILRGVIRLKLLIYFIIITLIPLFIHMRLKQTYSKHSKIGTSSNLTGAEVARKILDANGLHHVQIEATEGILSDHYDPRTKTVRLSSDNYWGNSIAGASVAAHEVGHAIQDAKNYSFLRFRHSLVPVANIGSGLSFPLILIGSLLSSANLLLLGIVAMGLAVLFQVITLPVEFDASKRAMIQMVETGIIQKEEKRGAKKVLNAAAMTYVAATAIAVLELLRFVLQFAGMTSND